MVEIRVEGARFKSASTVVVPVALSLRKAEALAVVVPPEPVIFTPLSVRTAAPVLVRSYPDVPAEKRSPAIVRGALKFGCVTGAVANRPTSLTPGTPPVQFAAVLKSVPVLFHVLAASMMSGGSGCRPLAAAKLALPARRRAA